jgi:predicted transcriptional regulator
VVAGALVLLTPAVEAGEIAEAVGSTGQGVKEILVRLAPAIN